MAIREIPKSYEYTCDVCDALHVQENANGHYTNSRPPNWATVSFQKNKDGTQLIDSSVCLLVCAACGEKIAKAIKGIQSDRASL